MEELKQAGKELAEHEEQLKIKARTLQKLRSEQQKKAS